MGKAGRIFCIAVPLALTLISLIFLVLIGLAQTNKDSNYLSNLYYLRADLSNIDAEFRSTLGKAANTTDSEAKDGSGNIKLLNYYTVGLWNYCAGNGTVVQNTDAALGQDTAHRVDYCTGRDITFSFDPRAAWGLDHEFTVRFFDDRLNGALDRYQDYFARAIGPLFIVTCASAGITALVSIGAAFSRIGSMVTTVFCSITTLLSFINAIVVTVAYAVLAGAFNAALRSHGVEFELGPSMLAYTWLTFVASFIAGLFWSFSSCCCSGKSREKRHFGKGKYQNLAGGHHEAGIPMKTGGWSGQGAQAYGVGHQGGQYEPYRHQTHH